MESEEREGILSWRFRTNDLHIIQSLVLNIWTPAPSVFEYILIIMLIRFDWKYTDMCDIYK